MQIRNNIFKMHLLKGVLWFLVSMPIIVMFFKEHGLNLTQVMLLQAIYSLSVALFEIPSGYISDIFGRKKSIILSTIFSFFGYLVFSFYGGFYAFAVAQVLVGIGGSLISGSDSALLYDTLLELQSEHDYTKIEGKNYAIGNFSEALAGIVGGLLAVSSIFLPVFVQTCILFISIPIAFSLVEPNIDSKNKLNYSLLSIIEVVRFSMIDNKRLRWLIIYSSIMGVATLSMAWFAQPFFDEIGMPLFYFGIIWASLNFSAGLTSFNAHKFLKRNNIHKIMIYISLTAIISFLALAINISYFGLIFIFIIYLLRGIITPILRNEININTTSNQRATVLSIRSFIIRISFAFFAPILGYIGEHFSLSNSFYSLALLVAFITLLSVYRLIRLD